LLGKGELTVKVTIEAVAATKGAISGIENAGGVLNLLNVGAAQSSATDLESSPAV
jgi:ribosomal protein L18E